MFVCLCICRGSADEFRGQMLRGGGGPAGGGVGAACLFPGGDGGKYDDSTETRTGLISIIWLHFGSCSKKLHCLAASSCMHGSQFSWNKFVVRNWPSFILFILMDIFKPLEIGGIPSQSAFSGCYNQSTFSSSNFSSTQRQRCCN